MAKNLPANAGDVDSIPGSGRSPGRGNDNPLHILGPGKIHGQRNLAGYSPRGHKESDLTEHKHKQAGFLSMLLDLKVGAERGGQS